MKIAFFEVEDWEKDFLQQRLSEHDLVFFDYPLTNETVNDAKGAEILSVFIYSQLTREVLQQTLDVRYITTRSTGFDHIDLSFCKERKILVSNVPEYGTHTVAEHTFALLLALTRNIIPSIERTRKGDFSIAGLTGMDLSGKTIGIVGFGHIGESVVHIAKGFGIHVVVYTRHPDEQTARRLGITFLGLKELLSVSDVITLHVPYTKETHHLINKRNVGLCKKGSILLNTARGGIIETEALLKGLDEGIFRGVGLDVLEEECYVKEERQLLTKNFLKECDVKTQLLNHVLLDRENVLVTPHNAFHSIEALEKILTVTLENVIRFTHHSPQNVV